jgi:formylglycine-generating enzyme required for sulfatase activity
VEGQDTRGFPVENVSWESAREYCDRLTEKLRGRGLVFRLPTEAEWEYAARGGAGNKDSLPFHFQDGPTAALSFRQANFNGSYPYGGGDRGTSLGRIARVASYAPNRFGLYDMHGNVWEWCQDYYGPYGKLATNKDPVQNEQQGANRRVLRGGSWYYDGCDCRAAGRLGGVPSDRDPVGFRVAASVQIP